MAKSGDLGAVWISEAEELLRLGRLDEAESQLERLRIIGEQGVRWHVARGLLLICRGDEIGARRHFERALQLDPQHANAAHNLGVLNGTLLSKQATPYSAPNFAEEREGYSTGIGSFPWIDRVRALWLVLGYGIGLSWAAVSISALRIAWPTIHTLIATNNMVEPPDPAKFDTIGPPSLILLVLGMGWTVCEVVHRRSGPNWLFAALILCAPTLFAPISFGWIPMLLLLIRGSRRHL